MAAENIDNTVNGSGLFPAKVPGLSDAADIQAALRLYHYGSYTYDGANTNPNNLVTPSIAKHLQNLVDADTAATAALAAHATDTTQIHGIENTADLATKSYVNDQILNSAPSFSDKAGEGIDWNAGDSRFDVEASLVNTNKVITKASSFTLDPADASKTILLSTPSTMNLTIPLNSAVAIPVGYKYHTIEIGEGVTAFTPSAGVTINSKNSQLFIDTQYGQATLIKVATDTWIAYGDIYESGSGPTTTVAPTTTAAPTTAATTGPTQTPGTDPTASESTINTFSFWILPSSVGNPVNGFSARFNSWSIVSAPIDGGTEANLLEFSKSCRNLVSLPISSGKVMMLF